MPRRTPASTTPSIEESTCLLPDVIADGAIQELAVWLDANTATIAPRLVGFADPTAEIRRVVGRLDAERDALSQALAARAESVFVNSPPFAESLRGRNGRDALWSFMRHWLCGTLIQEHASLIRALPDGYATGAELPRAA